MVEDAAVIAEMGEVVASLAGGTESGSITERVYIWKMYKSYFIKCNVENDRLIHNMNKTLV